MAEGSENAEGPGIGMRLSIAGISRKFPSVKNMTTEMLASLIKSARGTMTSTASPNQQDPRLFLLDSRPEAEYMISHVAESVRVEYEKDVETILEAVPELKTPGAKNIVCYCSVGYRSCMVAEKLEKYYKTQGGENSGAVKVYNLEGSLFKWANEKRPMVDYKQQTTIFAHPYNAIFGKLLNSDLRKWPEK